MVPKVGNYFGDPLCMEREITKGGPVSHTIFNIIVDAVVRAVMLEVCGTQEAHHIFGWQSGEHNIVLYTNNGQITGRNPIWVYRTLTSMVRMFERV